MELCGFGMQLSRQPSHILSPQLLSIAHWMVPWVDTDDAKKPSVRIGGNKICPPHAYPLNIIGLQPLRSPLIRKVESERIIEHFDKSWQEPCGEILFRKDLR